MVNRWLRAGLGSSQKQGVVRKATARRRAVSPVMPRWPAMMELRTCCLNRQGSCVFFCFKSGDKAREILDKFSI